MQINNTIILSSKCSIILDCILIMRKLNFFRALALLIMMASQASTSHHGKIMFCLGECLLGDKHLCQLYMLQGLIPPVRSLLSHP